MKLLWMWRVDHNVERLKVGTLFKELSVQVMAACFNLWIVEMGKRTNSRNSIDIKEIQ